MLQSLVFAPKRSGGNGMGESRCRSWDGIGRVHLNPTPVCVMPPPQTHTCPHACAPPQPTPAFPSLRKQPRGCLLLLPLSFASFPLKAVPLLPAYSRPAAAHAPPFSPHLSFTSWSHSHPRLSFTSNTKG